MADVSAEKQAMHEELADLRAKFGEFAPPIDWQPPEAMRGEPPRKLTASTKRSYFAQKRRKSMMTGIAIGLLLLASGLTGFADEMGHYFPPLQYAEWIGLGVLALALGMAVSYIWHRGHFRHVEQGRAIPGRVAGVFVWSRQVGNATQFGVGANVEFRDPETGALRIVDTRGDVLGSTVFARSFSIRLKQGDPVTLVYIPGKFEKTLATWELLGLDPDNQPIMKRGKPLQATPVVKALGITAAIFALGWFLFAGFFVWAFYMPDENGGFGMTMGIVAGAGALLGIVAGALSKKNVKGRRIVVMGGGLVLGLGLSILAGLVLLVGANVWFDRSKAEYHPVEIVNYWQKTTNGILRDYELEYTDLQTGQSGRQAVRHSTLVAFGDANVGMFAMRDGAFGWSYVSGIYPVRVFASDGAGSREVLAQTGDGTWEPVRLDLLVELEDGEYDEVPADLRRLAWKRMEQDGSIKPMPDDAAPVDATVPSSGSSPHAVPG
jgi:hypothetical protein